MTTLAHQNLGQGRGKEGVVIIHKIGRDLECDVSVDDSSVSREHAELRVGGDSLVLVDLGSTNGTCVRESGKWVEIEKATVVPGDRLLLGEVVTSVAALLERIEQNSQTPKETPALEAQLLKDKPKGPKLPQEITLEAGEAGAPLGPAFEAPSDSASPPASAPSAAPSFSEPPSRAEHNPPSGHARVVGRRPRSSGGKRPEYTEPMPPSRRPIIYSGIAARVNRAEPKPPEPSAVASVVSKLSDSGKAALIAALHRSRLMMWGAVTATVLVTGGVAAALLVQDGGITMSPDGSTAGLAGRPPERSQPVRRTIGRSSTRPIPHIAVGGPGEQRASIIIPAGTGYIVVGSAKPASGSKYDLWVARLSSDGKIIWQRHLGGAKNDLGLAATATADGGLLAAGAADNRSKAVIFKLGPAGETQWTRKLSQKRSRSSYSFISAISRSRKGGSVALLVTAPKRVADGGIPKNSGHATEVVRLAADGSITWRKRLSVSGLWGTSVVEMSGGGFAIAGVQKTADKNQLWAARIDARGEKIWAKSLPGKGADIRAWVRPARGRNLIIVTSHAVAASGATPRKAGARLVRLDDQGTVLRDRFDGQSNGLRVSGAFLVRGGIIVGGLLDSGAGGDGIIWIARYDVSHRAKWKRHYRVAGLATLGDIRQGRRRRIIFAGAVAGARTGQSDALVLSLSPSGNAPTN